MKHYLTASIKKSIYVFINYIKHYSSYFKCMFMIMMLKGCCNAVVLLFFSVWGLSLCYWHPMPLWSLKDAQCVKKSIFCVIIWQHIKSAQTGIHMEITVLNYFQSQTYHTFTSTIQRYFWRRPIVLAGMNSILSHTLHSSANMLPN